MYSAGLFVGLSAQADPRIEALKHGHRDAEGLRAIFADANAFRGDSTTQLRLLTNDKATHAAVSEALQELVAFARESRPEVVLVHFSCHGGPSGELVLYDCLVDQVRQTSLPVADLAHALSAIEHSQVILSLDCCFAGAVLGMPESPNRDALNSLLSLAGDGKFVVWAAQPGQKAWEDVEFAHGFLTHALIQGLTSSRTAGATALATATWITSACKHVQQLATRHGHIQTADCIARLASGASVMVPPIGEHQRSFSMDYGVLAVSDDIDSLERYKFDKATRDALRQRIGTGADAALNELQRDAVSPGGVLVGQSLLVRAPTSAGKTLVGELAMLAQWPVGRKTVVLLPMKAMVQEQAATLKAHYECLNLRVVVSTGEAAEDDDLLINQQFDVALLTYEKFYALLSLRPGLLSDLGLIVFDEVQLIEEDHRGQTVELLLMRAKQLQGARRFPQILVLCGELANLDDLQKWLGLQAVGSQTRPIPLHQGVVAIDGSCRILRGDSGEIETRRVAGLPALPSRARPNRNDADLRANAAIPIVREVLEQGKQVLLFCHHRWEVFRLADWLASDLKLDPVKLQLSDEGVDESRAGKRLRHYVKAGVGFHLGDLDPDERREVEGAFRRGELRILVATSTLAMGVNLPADVTLIVGADLHYDGAKHPLSVPKYRNMAGRAGRMLPNGPSSGISLLVAASKQEADILWARYIEADPPALKSTLGQLPPGERTLGLLHQRSSASPVDLARDLSQTFWGFAEGSAPRWMTDRRRETESALGELEALGLALQSTPGRWSLTSFGEVAASFGLRLASVVAVRHAAQRVVDAGLTFDGVCLLFLTQMTIELDEVIIPRPRETPLVRPLCPEVLSRYSDLWTLMIAGEGPTGCTTEAAANRAFRLWALLQWRSGKKLSDLEKWLDRRGDGSPVSGPLRSILDRTVDLLPAVAAIAVRVAPEQAQEIRRVLTAAKNQISVGGNAAAGEIFGLRLGLSREECRKLSEVGVTAASLRSDVTERHSELRAVIGDSRLQILASKLGDARHVRRLAGMSDQLVFEGLGDLTGL